MNPPTSPTLPERRRALLTGLTGQDGYYLARLLLGRGCEVSAIIHPAEQAAAEAIAAELGPITLIPADLAEGPALRAAVRDARPELVYHLAAQSSVGRSWEDPLGTARVNAMGTLELLEAIRLDAPGAGFVFASSCDCFDHEAAGEAGLTPQTPLLATNPYAATKVLGMQYVRFYRERFGLHANVAILFNHTSPRRPHWFVERAIVRQAASVSLGLAPAIEVGNLAVRRDWSWAEELVEAFAAMALLDPPGDLVLASGRTHAGGDWVDECCRQLGLDAAAVVHVDPARCHPGDRNHTHGNIDATIARLGWRPGTGVAEMVRRLLAIDVAELRAAAGA